MTHDGRCDLCGGPMAKLSGGSGYVCLEGHGKIELRPNSRVTFRAPVIEQQAKADAMRLLGRAVMR